MGQRKTSEVIMAEDFPKLTIDIKPWILNTWRRPSRINIKITYTKYIIVKLQETKDKEEILKEIEERMDTLSIWEQV